MHKSVKDKVTEKNKNTFKQFGTQGAIEVVQIKKFTWICV
jgi:hypothetical protein